MAASCDWSGQRGYGENTQLLGTTQRSESYSLVYLLFGCFDLVVHGNCTVLFSSRRNSLPILPLDISALLPAPGGGHRFWGRVVDTAAATTKFLVNFRDHFCCYRRRSDSCFYGSYAMELGRVRKGIVGIELTKTSQGKPSSPEHLAHVAPQGRKEQTTKAWFYEIRNSNNALLKRDGGFATQDAAKTAGRAGAKELKNVRQPDRPDVGRILSRPE